MTLLGGKGDKASFSRASERARKREGECKVDEDCREFAYSCEEGEIFNAGYSPLSLDYGIGISCIMQVTWDNFVVIVYVC